MLQRVRVLVLAVLISVAGLAVSPTAAQAATPTPAAMAAAKLRSAKIVNAARSQSGKPYRANSAGPHAFDCSGLTGFAYAWAGVRLPRTAAGQYQATRRISAAVARPGDLVFWLSGGRAYHVGVFAGAGRVWHAPKPGDRVKLAPIWSWSQVRFGRIGA